ncbi:Pre-mRNA-processing factor 19 [Xenoophorus captivus]|uniref:Pre-mRNA-processing factor 19 n=1 Tax=Xenoophorus captivus TaxID=1517983 RepID=A0ABV0S4H7_9TELE
MSAECIKPYRKNYGETFEHSIPENGSVLEFSPRGARPEAMPVVLWNRTNHGTSNTGRGRLLRGGKAWVAERVTQADQGNYTVKDDDGNVLSRSTLSVRGEQRQSKICFFVFFFTTWIPSMLIIMFCPLFIYIFLTYSYVLYFPFILLALVGYSFNITRFTKESLNLPLFLPVHHAHLIFTPSRISDESSLGPFDPKPPRGPIQLLREGQIMDHDLGYRVVICKCTFPPVCNEVPEHPCISPVSNHVFERRLIEKYIAENGTDPMNGQPLSEEQLVDIKVTHPIRPKAPSATSIPAILKSLQDEWDAVMLHSFTLRQQLQTTRQELSHALYQHDAACRVIARLNKEVTAAREALATLKPQAGLVAPQAVPASQPAAAGAGGEPMEISEQVGMTPEIIQKLQDKATILTTERKKRGKTVPEELVRAEDLSKYRQVASHAGLHSASVPGILSLDVCPSDTNKVLTGGADKNVVVFDKNEEQIVATLKGHAKKVTSVIYHPSQSVVFSASPDATIRVWSVTGGNCVQVVRAHEASVTGLSLHATGDYLLSSSEDQYWAFSDIQTGRVLTKVTDESAGCALTCAQFHPDGLIFGTGTADSQIKIWDLKERTNVANFPGHSGPVTSIAFSENGYYLATGAQDSSVKLWDLRKLKNFKTITLDNNYEVKSLVFDQSGTYLAVGGSDIRVYICKQWSEVLNFTDHTGLVTGVAFGENAKFLTSAGMDRSLRFYSL